MLYTRSIKFHSMGDFRNCEEKKLNLNEERDQSFAK